MKNGPHVPHFSFHYTTYPLSIPYTGWWHFSLISEVTHSLLTLRSTAHAFIILLKTLMSVKKQNVFSQMTASKLSQPSLEPGKEVAPSPTPRCNSKWKGSFWVTLDHGPTSLGEQKLKKDNCDSKRSCWSQSSSSILSSPPARKLLRFFWYQTLLLPSWLGL